MNNRTTNTDNGGIEAIEILQTSRASFGLVLMDCQMPRQNGYDTTKIIREWERKDETGRHVLPWPVLEEWGKELLVGKVN